MFIGSCTFYVSIVWAKSLKDKRQCIRSLMERMKHKFNISLAEIGCNDCINTAMIGFSCVSNSKAHVDEVLQNVISFAETITEAEIYNVEMEIL